MQEVMSAETALIKGSEVFFIIVQYLMDCLSKPKLTNKADVYTWTGDTMDGYSFPKTFCTF